MKNFVYASITCVITLSLWADEKVDFTQKIKPILESRCIDCHGPDKDKGDLRLHTKADALKTGDLAVIIPGKAEESSLYKRVTLPKDHDDIMPPKGDPLTKEQTELLKKWIDEGAAWPEGITLAGAAAEAGKAEEKKKKTPGSEFAHLTPVTESPAEQEAIKNLAAMGVSVRPVAQNLSWKEATVRPQDPGQSGEAVAQLKKIPSLVDLNLAGLKLKDEDLKHLAELKNLLRLHLENNPITDAGVAHLKSLVNLRYLNLYNTSVTDAGLEHLKGLTNLTSLYLWQTKVTDEGVSNLKKAVPAVAINRGEELKLAAAKVEEKKEEKPAEKKDQPAEAKKEEKKEEKPVEKKEGKPEEKKEPNPENPEEKKEEKKA